MWSYSKSFLLREMQPRRRSTFLVVLCLGFLLCAFFIAYSAFSEIQHHPTLKSLHVIFRHGHRTPSSSYPNDPYKNKIWTDGFGALTNKGKAQLYDVGRFLRQKYGSFLSDQYVVDQVSVLSSSVPRAQMSALTLLAGLFPPVRDQVWKTDLDWQPIPVNQIPRQLDHLITAKAACKAFDIEKQRSDIELNSQFYEIHKKLYSLLSTKSGDDIQSIADVEKLFYILSIQEENGLEMPEWARRVLPEMKSLASLNLASYTWSEKLKMLQGGSMLKEWISHFKSPSYGKLYLYSGHDLTLVNILRTVGFDELILPKYGAAIIVEFHHDKDLDEKQFLKFLYLNSSYSTELHDLKLKNCDINCPLEDFISLYDKYIPQDFTKECENTASKL
ncbi:prostatic acid phosphatase-like [Cimex lectularius]|uniref:Lysosomal acid phosphatase n=1 Tax=Cimex lectularius TaxID=79782 RepID=A0A8I6RWL5_CIMLE|nr:prostatic acid phosphatase-like [Cimex lectularius]